MDRVKLRLDQALVKHSLASTRSQAENYIKLGFVKINGKIINKSGYLISPSDKITLLTDEQYVSRAALKLQSVAEKLKINFKNKIILDVGSSTGGFTDFALQHGAKKVIAVDVGTNQLHPKLRTDIRVELHEQTDIREFRLSNIDYGRNTGENSKIDNPTSIIDIILIDVSFISLREILPKIHELVKNNTLIVAMVKPQFEAGEGQKHKGVIKNEKMRRNILQQIENWIQNLFIIVDKADSDVSGAKGNRERFYVLKKL
jgi:23S rRNA (cytidine1920-2'-O)/16S rRNA (cytidine1409-2'-O)-methyltransferase